MKKSIVTALCFALILLSAGCGNTPEPDYVVTGSITAIEDGAMTIEVKGDLPCRDPIEGMKSTSLNVPLTNMPSSPEPAFGDTVEITYNGRITTTTPEGGTEIYSISSADISHIEVKRTAEANEDSAASDPSCEEDPVNGKKKICIDNVVYKNTGIEVPIEPDASAVEYVEIPEGGDNSGIITAFAKIHEGNEDYLVCLIDEEWYKFTAE